MAKGYWENTIRNEIDFYKHIDYIHYNPVKHQLTNIVKEWRHSSFEKFLSLSLYEMNWGSFDDVKHIEEMCFE